jgi:adenosylmethionine-8-amino-7-oxononanoate aminotransferase
LSGSTWPDIFSSGTEGTEGAATVHDTEQRDNCMTLLRSVAADDGASEVYAFPATSVCGALGVLVPPERFACWVSHNIATSTNAGLASSGHSLNSLPVLAQYT